MIQFNNLEQLKSKSKISNFDAEYSMFKERVIEILSANVDCEPIFIAITGSTAYGLDLEKSDLDGKGVYIQNIDSILSELRIGEANTLSYKSQIGDLKKDIKKGKAKQDITLYELGRIIDLIGTNNPNCIELLDIPEDCIVYKHPIWDVLVKELKNNNVLSKRCQYTFFNYAEQQINKATGLNKKINNPIDKEKKTPLSFCYIIFDDNSTMELIPYLEKNCLDQKMCGLVKIPHARELYNLYYDHIAAPIFSKYADPIEAQQIRAGRLERGEHMGIGYIGIIKESEESDTVYNDVRVSSVPKEEKRIALLYYNKDGYNIYCKDYSLYWGEGGWMNMRNEERYKDNVSSGQNYDGKNLSHCLRLLYMAREIAEGKGVIVRRTDEQRDELLSVKRGKLTYDDIMNKCKEIKEGLSELYNNCNLPDEVSLENLSIVLKEIRKKYYKI